MAKCDLLIIGSGPAAWSCALTARQRGMSVTVAAAESAAGWLQKAERIDNYPGLPQVSGRELLRIFRQQAVDAGVNILPHQARNVMPMGTDGFMALVGNEVLESQCVVLATGAARPRLLPGEEELLGQGVSWCGTCDGMFFRNKEVAVLSAWTGGVEEAQFLSGLASHVDYYVLTRHDLPENAPFTLCDAVPTALRRLEEGRISILMATGKEKAYDGVFIFRPTVACEKLLPGLEMDGVFIRVDRRMATNIPGVFACGDCTGHPLQIAKAVGEGNIAAISAAEAIL